MPVAEIKSLEQFKTIINGDKPVVLDFWAVWCGPCRVISPVFEKFSDLPEFAEVGFYKVNTDEVPDVGQELQIRSLPTFIVFKEGNKVGELIGAIPDKLLKLVTDATSI